MDWARDKADFKFVDTLTILGCAVDGTGSAETMLHHRLVAAERAYWSKLRLWGTKTSRITKLNAWIRFIHPTVLHGTRTLHLSRQILHAVRKWEFALLRQIMKYRRRFWNTNDGTTHLEDVGRFNQRFSRLLYTHPLQGSQGEPHTREGTQGRI